MHVTHLLGRSLSQLPEWEGALFLSVTFTATMSQAWTPLPLYTDSPGYSGGFFFLPRYLIALCRWVVWIDYFVLRSNRTLDGPLL